MYAINLITLTFEGLTQDEKETLRGEILNLVIRGQSCFESAFFQSWCRHCGYTEAQKLMAMSTAYPQRAMICLLEAPK